MSWKRKRRVVHESRLKKINYSEKNGNVWLENLRRVFSSFRNRGLCRFLHLKVLFSIQLPAKINCKKNLFFSKNFVNFIDLWMLKNYFEFISDFEFFHVKVSLQSRPKMNSAKKIVFFSTNFVNFINLWNLEKLKFSLVSRPDNSTKRNDFETGFSYFLMWSLSRD